MECRVQVTMQIWSLIPKPFNSLVAATGLGADLATRTILSEIDILGVMVTSQVLFLQNTVISYSWTSPSSFSSAIVQCRVTLKPSTTGGRNSKRKKNEENVEGFYKDQLNSSTQYGGVSTFCLLGKFWA